MAPKKVDEKAGKSKTPLVVNKGAWTAEEDRKLSEFIQLHGAKNWKTVALKAGLSRCGKSCRLRWLNYLRPNIKRGNISEEEEDLILRLHKLLGNRWSLIAGRLPGRTDNEIKNYWNSHLSKKVGEKGIKIEIPAPPFVMPPEGDGSHSSAIEEEEEGEGEDQMVENEEDTEISFDMNELFDFSTEGTYGLNWVDKFLALDEDSNNSLDEKR